MAKKKRTPRSESKIQKLRAFLLEKESATLTECAQATGYTEKAVLVARSILANPLRTGQTLVTEYDRGIRIITVKKGKR